jgi:BirA family biotin operon repressor/biotin-[acetyl-CoA-carboxylase] ligase
MNSKHWLNSYKLLIFDEIDSTNEEARRLVNCGVGGNMVIWASKQTAGRGKGGVKWVSDEGNLYLSIILDLKKSEIESSPQISFLAAVALRNVLAKYIDKRKIQLKWPNDVLINGAKIAGILLESTIRLGKPVNQLVVGVGVNFLKYPKKNLEYKATSIISHTSDLTLEKLFDSYMQNFHEILQIWKKSGFEQLKQQWLDSAYKLGEVVTVKDVNQRITGVFNSINNKGEIMIELIDGRIVAINCGTI